MTSALEGVLERLTLLHPKAIDLSLDREMRLLKALGDPHLHLPPVVHVAGTNGKGSTIAFLRAMAEAEGKRVHVYTSPHLVRFNERIRIAGTLISDEDLLALLDEVETVNAGAPATFFEITTCAAFLAFARAEADLVLLETGLGGRLDATNVVPNPLLTVLTPIDYDHQNYLGDTLSAIAGEKAGIFKDGRPCVSALQRSEALEVIQARAAETESKLWLHGSDFLSQKRGENLILSSGEGEEIYPLPALAGAYQIENAGVALAAAKLLQFSPAARAEGLRRVEWPARMQRLVRGPLVEALPGSWELWLDGGHNPHAGRALASFLPGWGDRPLDVVVGMLDTKDEAGFLAALAPFVARLRTVPVHQSAASRDPAQVAETARRVGIADVAPCPDVGAAVASFGREGCRRVLIVGSLYLAGEILADNG